MLLFCLGSAPWTIAAARAERRRRRARRAARMFAPPAKVGLEAALTRIALYQPPGNGGRLAVRHYLHAGRVAGGLVSSGSLLQTVA
ncbi:hypothetical protein [Paludibacterium purpuratum]|uniref:Uncharacterized protein n=1 Tax=Paludibacterium purpuratum TaxID=1144873 RepID=A0A4R7B4Z4_9NEIS|nr:hypothetical protein [Paludibacterium purpuratum]TDR79661.1 hypothetical protein DFP86_10724 [Paludibacterium purpuratum]